MKRKRKKCEEEAAKVYDEASKRKGEERGRRKVAMDMKLAAVGRWKGE